jgi:hypothetical protein
LVFNPRERELEKVLMRTSGTKREGVTRSRRELYSKEPETYQHVVV